MTLPPLQNQNCEQVKSPEPDTWRHVRANLDFDRRPHRRRTGTLPFAARGATLLTPLFCEVH